MREELAEQMNEEKLIEIFQQIIIEAKLLSDWNFSNAHKLDRLNEKRHSLTGYLVELGIESHMSIAYGTDETNREISIGLETRPKRKKDLPFYEGNYYKGIRHLIDEIESYIINLKKAIEKK